MPQYMGRPTEGFSFAPKLEQLITLYSELDARTASLRRTTGLDCTPGCGACCDTPSRNIECSDFELLPLAVALWRAGEAEFRLQMASSSSPEGPCLFYDKAGILAAGRCGAYRLRPLVCRFFGFAAERDKHGAPRLTLCRPLKLQNPALASIAAGMVASGVEVPMIGHYMSELHSIEPAAAARRFPVNDALRRALETVLYQAELLGLRPRREGESSPGLEEAAH